MEGNTQVTDYPQKFVRDMEQAAAALRKAESVTVVSHIDADGITSGAIASETLGRLGIPHELVFEKKITDEVVRRVNGDPNDFVWICDLGSAYMSQFTRDGLVVTDHHVPDPKWRVGQSSLDFFRTSYQLNPHLYGVSGTYGICGAGMTYLLSKTIDPGNRDLAYLAVVGAVGDFQDSDESKLISWNRPVLRDAVEAGDIVVSNGIRYYGRGTRPIVQYLQYGEPAIPGLAGDADACIGFLSSRGISAYGSDGKKRTWGDLDEVSGLLLTDELFEMVPEKDRGAFIGEIYTITRYPLKSGLGDAKEFATTLNSCGRYDDAETGARICKGDMNALREAENNRRDHRKNISSALNYVKENNLVTQYKSIQYFNAGSAIRETVVGIVAGMILGSEKAKNKPIIAFADADDGVKVSARAPKDLVDNGLDLAGIMGKASEYVGGMGGGHTVAAGATIPKGKETVFLEKVEELVSFGINP